MCILATLLVAPAMTDGMKPSTYTGIAKAMLDGLTVDVMVSETAIEKVEVVSHNETSPGGRRRHDGFHQACRGSAEAAVRYSPVMSSFEVPSSVIRLPIRRTAFWIPTRFGRSPARPMASSMSITRASAMSLRVSAATCARTPPLLRASFPRILSLTGTWSRTTRLRKSWLPVLPAAYSEGRDA